MVAVHGGAPVRLLQVVADALHTPVPLDLALGRHQEGRAVRLDGGLGRVDQGQTVGDGVLGEGVLLGEVARGLVDDGAEVTHVQAGELAPDRGQPHPLLGVLEGHVDGLVRDAGVLGVEGHGPAAEHVVGVVEQRGLGGPGDDESAALRGRRPELCGGRGTEGGY